MIVTKEEIDLANPNVIHAVELAHLAWCEQMDREAAGWGERYLASAPIPMTGFSLRVRAASVIAVMKDARCEQHDLVVVEPTPVVRPSEITRFLHDPLLMRFMTLANDAWDEEVTRAGYDIEPVPFLEKYRGRAKALFAASQLAVLKCIPTVSLSGSKLRRLSSKVVSS